MIIHIWQQFQIVTQERLFGYYYSDLEKNIAVKEEQKLSKEDIKLEEILEKLEIANNELNKTDIELDKSIEIYTEAMKLVSVGNEKLKKAEEKIAKFIDEKEQKEIEE